MAAQIAERKSRIDILINNAGALFATRRLTHDGLERTSALKSHGLFRHDRGIARAALGLRSRAYHQHSFSASHQGATLDFDDLQSAKSFGALKVYVGSRSYATSCSRVSSPAACMARASFWIATSRVCRYSFRRSNGALISRLVRFAKCFAISPAKGAETIIYLASSPDMAETTGQYFYRCATTMPSQGGPGRAFCFIALAAQRGIGRNERITRSNTTLPLDAPQSRSKKLRFIS